MKKRSIGLIETRGFTPAVAAADAGVKAANVTLLGCHLTWPALATVTFQGDVAAVRAAVASGSAAARAVGVVIATHVIARPDAEYKDTDSFNEDPFASHGRGENGGTPEVEEVTEPTLDEVKKPAAPRKRGSAKPDSAAAKKKPASARPSKKAATRQVKPRTTQQDSPKVEKVEKKKGDARDTATTDQKVAPEQAGATAGIQPTDNDDLSGPAAKTAAAKKTQQAKRKRAVSRRRTTRQRQKAQDTAPAAKATENTAEKKSSIEESLPQEQKSDGTTAAQQADDSAKQSKTQTKSSDKPIS